VNPVAVMIGITIVSFTVVGSALIGSPAPKPKETA
jgi:hypothetical protein